MNTKWLILVIFAFIANYLYYQYKQSEETFESCEHYKLVSEYFLDKGNKKKPILWIHTSTEINARNWESFGSRNTNQLNQPYLHMTMKSIYDKCKDSFNICLINDDSFASLLSWNIQLDDLSDPIKTHYRKLGLCMILHEYGGLLVPQSFLCMQDLKPLSRELNFAIETTNRSVNQGYLPDIVFMGCKKKNVTMKHLIEYQEQLYKDKTEQSDFNGSVSSWIQHHFKIIDGSSIGIKKIDYSPVTLQDLLGTTELHIPYHYGIYMPQEEILQRPKYSWFARMSTDQILESPFLFSTYIKLAYAQSDC